MFINSSEKSNDIKKMFQYDVQHLKKHLGSQIKEGEVSDTMASVLNFRVHDTDKNGYLDGLELRRMIAHHNEDIRGIKITEEQTIRMIMAMINTSDTNEDCLISYAEFVKVVEDK
uniref:Multiple coagulation factor deficiency protein 2 homolog (Trinotate prediction) n=1 Tax=Henneguya salminicola TaxID=69463 RepID=A0A6G3MMC7_HENSL